MDCDCQQGCSGPPFLVSDDLQDKEKRFNNSRKAVLKNNEES